MAYAEKHLILASASPRRRELLGRFSLPFDIVPAEGEEAPPGQLPPDEYVRALAKAKALSSASIARDPRAVYIAADTVVEIDGRILGKPADADAAHAMLRRLSGEAHRVWSGLCVREGEHIECEHECTEVRFRELSDEEILAYIATGEPMDKAGAYGIQGRASLFVEGIRGDYFNVVGLPLCRLGRMLRRFDIDLL